MYARLIKTFLTLLLGFTGALLGLSYYIGYASEQAVRQQFRKHQAQASLRGYEWTLERYERDWFSSRAAVRVQSLGEAQGPAELRVTSALRLHHGPVLPLEDGWRIGLFALQAQLGTDSQLAPVSLVTPIERLLDQLLVIGRFDGDYQVVWTLPQLQLQLQQGDQVLSLSGGELLWQGPFQEMAGAGALSFEQLSIQWPGAMGLTVTESDLEFELAHRRGWAFEGRGQLNSQQGVWAGPGQLPIKFSQLQWRWAQTIEPPHINTNHQLNLERLDAGPLVLKELTASTQVYGLPLETLHHWQQLANQSRASGQERFVANQWLAVADDRLRQALRAEGTLGAEIGVGELNAQWQADYRGRPAGERINATSWRDWAELLDGQLTLNVSEAALTGTPLYWLLAESVDRYLPPGNRPAGSQRRLLAIWRDGTLSLNP